MDAINIKDYDPNISEMLCFVANKLNIMPYDILAKLCCEFHDVISSFRDSLRLQTRVTSQYNVSEHRVWTWSAHGSFLTIKSVIKYIAYAVCLYILLNNIHTIIIFIKHIWRIYPLRL